MASAQGKMPETVPDLRQETLDRLRHWFEETKNPLYAWEAIARCLSYDDPPSIPDWCIPCLRDAAMNLWRLSWGQDFREGAARISPDDAMALVPHALSLSRQGKKNAFATLLQDQHAMRDALDFHTWAHGGSVLEEIKQRRKSAFYASTLEEIKRRRNVESDRARRIIARGMRLLRLR
jgi:hypothetical protein